MKEHQFYQLYLAIRLHFSSDDYDIVKNKGRVNFSPEKLEKNVKMMNVLRKFTKKYKVSEFAQYCAANTLAGDKWCGIYSEEGETIYRKWLKRQNSVSYFLLQDVAAIIDSLPEGAPFSDAWETPAKGHPLILRMFLGEAIGFDTFAILNTYYKFELKLTERLQDDPVWQQTRKQVIKGTPFLQHYSPLKARVVKLTGLQINEETI